MSLDLDPDALGALYRDHAESLLVYFTRRCYDPQQALDLVGETFARAHVARGRFRGESWEEAEGWVFGIARHVLADALRRGRAERRALARLGVEPPCLADDELARVEQLAGLVDRRAALAEGRS